MLTPHADAVQGAPVPGDELIAVDSQPVIAESDEELEDARAELVDRYGEPPVAVRHLLDGRREAPPLKPPGMTMSVSRRSTCAPCFCHSAIASCPGCLDGADRVPGRIGARGVKLVVREEQRVSYTRRIDVPSRIISAPGGALRQRRTATGTTPATPGCKRGIAAKLPSTHQSTVASGICRRMSLTTGRLWITSPSEEVFTSRMRIGG